MNDNIKKIIEGKDVALVGNASSIFHKPRPIDNHEIVIRMNKGFPKKGIGCRTDILALSLPLDEGTISRQYAPKEILWCTSKYDLMTDYLEKVAIKFPFSTWKMLEYVLEARPSTGLMTFFHVFTECKNITLYGFDFWVTPNWYTETIHVGPHNVKKEKELITDLISVKGKLVI